MTYSTPLFAGTSDELSLVPKWWNPRPASSPGKPRLRRVLAWDGGYVWECECSVVRGFGRTPVAAWSHWRGRHWLNAQLREATR